MNEKKKILILNGQYAPGYKGGGPIQSCINMVENLHEAFDFYVLCSDRDYKEDKAYPNIKTNKWNQVGSAKVFYMSPEMQSFSGFKKILNSFEYDALYLNGFFSPVFTILPLILLRLGRIKKSKVILTPRGDFTGGCENKKLKKYTYIYLAKLFGLYKNLVWHATSEIEEKDIKQKFKNARILTVSNLPAKFIEKAPVIKKQSGELRLVFVSRIFPKKNLKYALEILKEIKNGKIIFDIYGPMEDKAYWSECESLIKEMPSNVKVKYCGEAKHKDIPNIFEQYHAFFFPTLGENYGHVIVEAMMNNCLCILSKGTTPWDDYAKCGDLVCNLDKRQQFNKSIEWLLGLSNEEFQILIELNTDYIKLKIRSDETISKYIEMIENIF